MCDAAAAHAHQIDSKRGESPKCHITTVHPVVSVAASVRLRQVIGILIWAKAGVQGLRRRVSAETDTTWRVVGLACAVAGGGPPIKRRGKELARRRRHNLARRRQRRRRPLRRIGKGHGDVVHGTWRSNPAFPLAPSGARSSCSSPIDSPAVSCTGQIFIQPLHYWTWQTNMLAS